MTPKLLLAQRLRDLCAGQGGPDAVALEIGASAENLRQIIAGTKLPSGEPRGVGPALQRKLEARYPGWAALPAAPDPASSMSPQARQLAASLDAIGDPRTHAAAFLAAMSAIDGATNGKRDGTHG